MEISLREIRTFGDCPIMGSLELLLLDTNIILLCSRRPVDFSHFLTSLPSSALHSYDDEGVLTHLWRDILTSCLHSGEVAVWLQETRRLF